MNPGCNCPVLKAHRKWHRYMPPFRCVDWLCWWHNYVADVVPPSTALAFVSKRGEKCKSTSPSALQVKNWQKTISTEDKLDWIKPTQRRWKNCWHMS